MISLNPHSLYFAPFLIFLFNIFWHTHTCCENFKISFERIFVWSFLILYEWEKKPAEWEKKPKNTKNRFYAFLWTTCCMNEKALKVLQCINGFLSGFSRFSVFYSLFFYILCIIKSCSNTFVCEVESASQVKARKALSRYFNTKNFSAPLMIVSRDYYLQPFHVFPHILSIATYICLYSCN